LAESANPFFYGMFRFPVEIWKKIWYNKGRKQGRRGNGCRLRDVNIKDGKTNEPKHTHPTSNPKTAAAPHPGTAAETPAGTATETLAGATAETPAGTTAETSSGATAKTAAVSPSETPAASASGRRIGARQDDHRDLLSNQPVLAFDRTCGIAGDRHGHLGDRLGDGRL